MGENCVSRGHTPACSKAPDGRNRWTLQLFRTYALTLALFCGLKDKGR